MTVAIPRYEGAEVLGLPREEVIVLTNSERLTAACPRRWWFSEPEGLRAKGAIARPLRYGDAWHHVMEDVYGWWASADRDYPGDGLQTCAWCGGAPLVRATCARCGGTGLGPVARIERRWKDAVRAEQFEARREGRGVLLDEEKADADVETLRRAAEGYFAFRGGPHPSQVIRILHVELAIARVIVNPKTGKPFCPSVYLIEEKNGALRMARTSEAVDPPAGTRVHKVRWPWVQVMRLDHLAEYRDEPRALVFGEFKSSGSVAGYIEGLSVDTQVPGYGWGLEGVIASGAIPGLQGRQIAGYHYDVSYSGRQHDPEPLKKGGLSIAKNRTTPSWRYLDTVRRLGLDPAEYAEHVQWCAREVDPKLYRLELGIIGKETRARYAIEIAGVATRHAEYWRKAATSRNYRDIEFRFPRNPVCKVGGSVRCPFRGPCNQDGEQVRQNFDVRPVTAWTFGSDDDDDT